MEHRDQGRRDDLWSWLYVLVELVAGEGWGALSAFLSFP